MATGLFDQSEKETKIRITRLDNLLLSYRTLEGEFPSDRLPKGATGNPANSAAEALFLALFDDEYTGDQPDQDWLVNTDFDSSTKALTRLPSKELFEIGDAWGNPLVYRDSLHYGTAVEVWAGFEGEYEPQQVEARRNAKTGAWENPSGYQILSAGEDGLFGTEDDLTNFEEG